jgi:hypothetical protein
MNGGCRTGQVVDLIHFEVDGVGDIVTNAFEVVIPEEMADVVLAAREKIVKAQDLLSFGEKPFAQVRSEKTGAAGDENPFHPARSPM